ncbi:MAG TPA: helix-turn-helix domain-containing protein [Frankiaceae bacterium]|jgi:hypothetical protein|nr:helix-turn-helix domain-containing protein [Frankiaceae bacterium]
MSIGADLAAAREAAGRTIDDVSRATRIRGELLRRIEDDDFSGCGGAVYARGHIRSIATHLGLDPAPFVAEFDRTNAAAAPAAREIFEHEVIAMPDRKGPNWTGAMAVMAGVLLVIALVSVFTANAPAGSPPAAAPLTSSSPSPSVAPSSAPTSQPPLVAGNIGGVNLRVKVVNNRSWVTVRADGKTVFEGLMRAPMQQDFAAKNKINVVFGNAGAVQIVVNGRDLGSPGRAGDVVRLEFLPGDPATTSG